MRFEASRPLYLLVCVCISLQHARGFSLGRICLLWKVRGHSLVVIGHVQSVPTRYVEGDSDGISTRSAACLRNLIFVQGVKTMWQNDEVCVCQLSWYGWE